MKPDLLLGTDELRIIGHSINWLLNTPLGPDALPQVSEGEAFILTRLFDDICALNKISLMRSENIVIVIDEPYSLAQSRLQLPPAQMHLLTDAVKTFYGTLQATPIEITVITGLPVSQTATLLSRLEAASQGS